MFRFKVSLAALCFLATTLVQAGIYFIPHPNYDAPVYFSGTNARAFFSAEITNPDIHVEAAQLLLDGELVVSETYPVGGTPTKPVYLHNRTLAVMFDSNHFANGEAVEVKMRAKAGDTWYEDTYTAPARNKAMLMGLDYYETPTAPYGVYQGTQGCTALNAWITGIGYDTAFRYDQWDDSDFESEMDQNVNFLMYCGHASSVALYTGEHVGVNSANHPVGNPIYCDSTIGTPDIFSMRQLDVGYFNPGDCLPPFNAGYHPPINVAFLLACDTTASSYDMLPILFPYENGYGGYLEDQAVVGFTVPIFVNDYWFLGDKFAEPLVAGYSAEQSALDMVNEARDAGKTVYSGALFSTAHIRVLGDTWAVIKNVYNPGARLLTWHREITI